MKRRHFTLNLALCAATGLRPTWANTAPRLLVLGDSLSAEYGLKRGSGWVQSLSDRLAQHQPSVQVINASISGDTTAGGRTRLGALLRQHQPQIVIIELGGNDALRGLALEVTRANLSAMAQACQQAGAQTLLLGMEMPPNYGQRYAQTFREVYQTVAKQHQIPLVPFFLKGVADTPDPRRWFQSDGIHPNEAAQAQMLNNVWPALVPMLALLAKAHNKKPHNKTLPAAPSRATPG